MTHHRRLWAALTLSVIAGVTAGCSSPAAPTAGAQPARSTQQAAGHATSTAAAPKASTPRARKTSGSKVGQPAYCAPLAVAYEYKKIMPGMPSAADSQKLGKLIDTATAAATAGGKTEVAGFLSQLAKVSANPLGGGLPPIQALSVSMKKTGPVILKECGIDLSGKSSK